MLNLQRLGHGAEAYYLDQVVSGVEDYYGEAGEAPGYWLASSNYLLGLDGMVDADDLRAVLSGVDPSSGEQMHRAANRKVPGWDLTFRAPKSVSILWALGEETTSGEVVAAHDAAVARAMLYLERQAGYTRTGKNGVNRVAVEGFVAAGFRHRTSRDRDPLLHTHVLVPNSVRAEDGRWRTIDAKGLYDHARTAGFLYQVELRHELTARLGVDWTPVVNGLADIDGVDDGLIRLFSKRREAIEAKMAEWGATSAKAAQVSTLESRRAKSDRPEPLGEQLARWRAEAEAAGFDPDIDLAGMEHREVPDVDSSASAGLVWFDRLSSQYGLTNHHSTFDRRDVIQALTGILPAGVTAAQVERISFHYLDRKDVLRVGFRDRTGSTYTTKELWDLETQLVGLVGRGGDGRFGLAGDDAVDLALWARPSVSVEQADAVRELCTSGRPVDVMVAAAGTGKTFSLDAAREAWERTGHQVIGCALAATAARQLQSGSGIQSATIAGVGLFIARGEIQLGRNSVIVIDEAGMAGTRDLATVMIPAAKAGAKVVLVGDPKQLPEIHAGGLLAHAETRRHVITLTENRRQTDPTEIEALLELRAGDVDRAIGLLRERGGIVRGDNSDQVRNGMVAEWWRHRQAGDEALMLARRNVDVDDLNRRARGLLVESGGLSGQVMVIKDRPFQVGDEIVCLRNDYLAAVRNGTIGTITAIDHDQRRLTIDTEEGPRQLDAAYVDAGQVRHGYAVTVHKAQGRTTDHGLLLGTDDLTRESGYVGLSRGRDSNRLYIVDTDHDGDLEAHTRRDDRTDPSEIVLAALHASAPKQLAIDQTPAPDHDAGIDIGL